MEMINKCINDSSNKQVIIYNKGKINMHSTDQRSRAKSGR